MNESDWEKVIVVCLALMTVLALVFTALFRVWIIESDLPLWLKAILWG